MSQTVKLPEGKSWSSMTTGWIGVAREALEAMSLGGISLHLVVVGPRPLLGRVLLCVFWLVPWFHVHFHTCRMLRYWPLLVSALLCMHVTNTLWLLGWSWKRLWSCASVAPFSCYPPINIDFLQDKAPKNHGKSMLSRQMINIQVNALIFHSFFNAFPGGLPATDRSLPWSPSKQFRLWNTFVPFNIHPAGDVSGTYKWWCILNTVCRLMEMS